MKFLPYERLTIKTRLSAQEVLERLNGCVEPKRYFRFFGSNTKPYQGKVQDSHFEISRIIGYRNSFLPMIKGEVRAEISGSSIYITMAPHIFVIGFMVFWVGSVGLFFLGGLWDALSTVGQATAVNYSFLITPDWMFLFICVLFIGFFKFESIKSKNFFRELFESVEVEEMDIFTPRG